MKLSRLLALIRLANNNPNENEANLAARTVCKVLGNNPHFMKTGSLEVRTAQAKVGVTPDGKANTVTWNDVRRSTEPFWRSKPPTGPGNPFRPGGYNSRYYGPDFEQMWEYFNNIPRKEAPEPENSWDRETGRPPWEAGPFKTDHKTGKSEYTYNPITGQRTYREELRKCSKCGLEIMTRRIHENPWVCNPCHWKEGP
jgi:ribosomal protein S27AE